MTHAVIAIDPSMTSTGVAVWLCYNVDAPSPVSARSALVSAADRRCVLATSSSYRKSSGFGALESAIRDAVHPSYVWIAVIERPPYAKHGVRAAPVEAEHRWVEWIERLARERAAEQGVRYRVPTIVRPDPSMWRAPIGLPTRGVGATPLARRIDLKDKACALVRHEAQRTNSAVLLEASIDDDASEAALIGLWAMRCVVPFDRFLTKTRYRGRTTTKAEALRWAV